MSRTVKPDDYPLYIAIDKNTRKVLGFIVLSATQDTLRKGAAVRIWYVYAVGVVAWVRLAQRQHEVPKEQRMGLQLIRHALQHAATHPHRRVKSMCNILTATIDNRNVASARAFRTAWELEGWALMHYCPCDGGRLDTTKTAEEQEKGSFKVVLYRELPDYDKQLDMEVLLIYPGNHGASGGHW